MAVQNKISINHFVLKYRWFLMSLVSIIVIVVEYFEHLDFGEYFFGGGFVWETLVFGVLMPISVGLLLSLIYDRTKINAILARIDRQRTLKNALLSARDWDELVTLISQIPHTIFPALFGDALYIFDPELKRFIRVSAWMSVEGKFPELYPFEIDAEQGSKANSELNVKNLPYQQYQTAVTAQNMVVYSWPVVHLEDPVAVIRLIFLNDHLPKEENLVAFGELIVDIALAIQNFHKTDFIFESAAAQAERQRIARQLHDTLAQDLAFLRLKLEQLLYNDRARTGGDFGNELFRLYKTADHSYEQVRHSLRSMRGETKLEFSDALYEFANTIADNSNFKVEITQEGSPSELSVEMQRKILYIMREVLRNVGKHAHANLANIKITWETDFVQIDADDNGKGFDVNTALNKTQSCGLNIIEEVVAELNGHFDLESQENAGTSIRLWFPIMHGDSAGFDR